MMKREVIMFKIRNLHKHCSEEILYQMFILLWEILFFNKSKSIYPRKSEFSLELTSCLHKFFYGTTHSFSFITIAKNPCTHNYCLNSIVQSPGFVQRSRIRTSIFIFTVCIYYYFYLVRMAGKELEDEQDFTPMHVAFRSTW